MSKLTAIQLFGDPNTNHECCTCCAGYCPMQEGGWEPRQPELFGVTIDGTEYITDRYVAVRADLLEPVEVVSTIQQPTAADWSVPDSKPDTSTARFVPSRAARILDAGFTIHGYASDLSQKQHIYQGDTHVGWAMGVTVESPSGTTLADLPRIRSVAAMFDEGGWPYAPADGYPLDNAAAVLHSLEWINNGGDVLMSALRQPAGGEA